MKVQKRKLMRIFLVPLLLVVLFQGIMPFFYAYGQWRKRYYGKQCGEPGQLPGEKPGSDAGKCNGRAMEQHS